MLGVPAVGHDNVVQYFGLYLLVQEIRRVNVFRILRPQMVGEDDDVRGRVLDYGQALVYGLNLPLGELPAHVLKAFLNFAMIKLFLAYINFIFELYHDLDYFIEHFLMRLLR